MSKQIYLAGALLFALSLSACSSVHDAKPNSKVYRSTASEVIKQLEYAKTHYNNPNKEVFGDLGGTDCVNFASQTLLSRGWSLNKDWTYKDGYV
jgi:hypothetical protein